MYLFNAQINKRLNAKKTFFKLSSQSNGIIATASNNYSIIEIVKQPLIIFLAAVLSFKKKPTKK